MSIQTIVMEPSSSCTPILYPFRPLRPLPRAPRSRRYASLLGRDIVVRYHHLPPELWEAIHDYLPYQDLKSLALVNKHVGLFARDRLGRRLRSMKATSAVFRSFFTSHSPRGVPAFAFKIRSLTLYLSSTSQDAKSLSSSNAVLRHWVRVSRDLHHLRELAFLGTSVRFTGTRDLLAALPPTARLHRFLCEDDRLLLDSLDSLLNHRETLEDFGGWFDTAIILSDRTPDDFLAAFSNIHTLDVGMSFVLSQSKGGAVTNLHVRLEWAWTLPVVWSISEAFGAQVRALRLERNGVVDGGWIWDGLDHEWVQGPESPLLLCAHLNMPALRYLEVRDTAPPAAPEPEVLQLGGTKPPRGPYAWALGHSSWMEYSDYAGVPNLDHLVWRPTWAAKGGEHRDCADAFVRMAGDLLPVLSVWMSLEERTSGVWDTWIRIDEDFPLERKCVWDAVKEDSWKRME